MSIRQYINWGTIVKGSLQVALYLLLGLVLALFISRPVHAAGLDCPPPYGYCYNGQYEYPYDNGNEETENDDNYNGYPDNGSNGYNGDNGYNGNGDNGYNYLPPPVYDPQAGYL